MASISQEVEVSNNGQYFQKIRELSSSHAYINVPIPVLGALEPLDCVSRCIWVTLYQLGYFENGAVTITLTALANKLNISRSSLESKIGTLVQGGFLIKKHNVDENHQYLASTYFVRLPDDMLDTIAQQPSRKDILNDVGRYMTKHLQKDKPITAPVEMIQEQMIHEELGEIRATKEETLNKLAKLEKTAHPGLASKVEAIALKAKLKSLTEREEKNLLTEQSTASPNKKGGSPNHWESYINNSRKIDIINNNKHPFIEATPPTSDIHRLSTAFCSFASQDIGKQRSGKGYRNEPVKLPEKIKTKIHKAVYDLKTIANPEAVIAEGEFAVSRCFTGVTLDHAANTFCKLLMQNKWTTPIPLRMANQEPDDLYGDQRKGGRL